VIFIKIVVIGDGKLGYLVSEQLSKEGHDVVIVDKNQNILDSSQEKLDIAIVTGNGASVETQRAAGVQDCDIIISVTSSDEVNLLSSLIARKLGCKHIIARVRNFEYDKQISFLKSDLGLSFSVNPEKTTAREIFRLLEYPSFLKRNSFAHGRAEMVEIRIDKDSVLSDKRVDEIGSIFKQKALICAIERDGKVFIPSGSFLLKHRDKLTVVTATSKLPELMQRLGFKSVDISRVMIIGGSRSAVYLSNELLSLGVSVTIIEQSHSRCLELCDALPRATIIEGDGTLHDLLLEEGIQKTDAVVTLTGIDEENLIVAMYSKYIGVPKTITKVTRLEYTEMLSRVNIDAIVCPRVLTTNEITRYIRAIGASREGSVETLYSIAEGQVEALGFTVPEVGPHLNVSLADMKLQPNILIAAIIRNGEVIVPQGSDSFKPNDSIIVIADSSKAISNLSEIFADTVPPEEGKK
jgi:trk system potassium uptake protein TrkA